MWPGSVRRRASGIRQYKGGRNNFPSAEEKSKANLGSNPRMASDGRRCCSELASSALSKAA